MDRSVVIDSMAYIPRAFVAPVPSEVPPGKAPAAMLDRASATVLSSPSI